MKYLAMIKEKINIERQNLNNLILKGLEGEDLLRSSQRLDNLINEYYRRLLDREKAY